MKKIIVGFFALALLLTSTSAFAAWNTYPSDCPLPLSIGNYTTGDGIQNGSNGCWTKTSVSATAGQTINIAVYYDNTNNTDAANTVIHLTQSPSGSITNPSSTFTFSGSLTSSAGTLNLSQVTANLTSSQTLTFGQAQWFKMGSNSGVSLPNGQTGYEAFSSGLSLGTIHNGDWGTVLFSFSVGTSGNVQTCQDPSASNYGGPLPCTYPQNNCYISNFTVNGSTSTTIQSGQAANFVWNTTGCTSVNVSGPNLYSSSLSGSQTTYPQNSGTYTITAYGNNSGTQTQTVYVNVNSNYFNNCYISNFTVNGSTSTTIQSGQAANFVWNTTGCTSVNVSGPNLYSSSLSGSQTTYPQNSGTYTITAYGNNSGTQTQTVYVNVNQIINPPIYTPPIYIPPVVYNTCAVTTVATNVTQNSATLNGLLTNSTGASYFEYGPSVNLGSQTVSRVGSGAFSEVVSGLSSDTPYYFRFVSQCSGGLSYGKIEVFQTTGTHIVRPIIVQGTTVIGTQSPIMLKIEDRYQSIGPGDTVDYTVTYKNIGKSLLTNPVVQVIVPKGITLVNSSAGTYSPDTNTLTVPIEDLKPGDEGVIYLQGHVDILDSNTAQIVTTAILVYTNPNGAQENAIAYVLNNPKGYVNNLGAAAFFAGIFPNTLLGWLLLIILILLIILVTRRYASKSVVHTTTPTGAHTTTTTNY